MNKFIRKNGFSQILILIIISFLAIALPITTKLVQKSQENRSSAREACEKGETKCVSGKKYTCSSNYSWVQTGTCTQPSNPCTVRYGSWSACKDGTQTRTVTIEPAGCSGGATAGPSSQKCTIPITCTSFTTGAWGACNRYADGEDYQTRTVTGSPSGCTGGTPPINKQSCSNDCSAVGGGCFNVATCNDEGGKVVPNTRQCGNQGLTCCVVASPECTPATTRCASTSKEQKCGDDKKWGLPVACASGVCESNACKVDGDGQQHNPPPPDPTPADIGDTGVGGKLSFKFSYDGVGPENIKCWDNFKTVKLVVGAVGTSITQEILAVGVTTSSPINNKIPTNSKGYAVFEANNIPLNIGFSGLTNIYARIKGQVHASIYYCTKSQAAKNTSQICNLSLDGTVNNLYEYPVLAGDVNQDGAVKADDYTLIKDASYTEGCGIKADLNGDGTVNRFDIDLYKFALEAIYDE